jgi:hypothetical protein
MPIIYSYPLVTVPEPTDLFIISKTIEDENRIETKSIKFEDLQESLTGDKTFVFTQGVAANFWDITHNLNKFPSVQVVDTGENSILGFQINYVNNNRLTLTFITPFAGKAFLN